MLHTWLPNSNGGMMPAAAAATALLELASFRRLPDVGQEGALIDAATGDVMQAHHTDAQPIFMWAGGDSPRLLMGIDNGGFFITPMPPGRSGVAAARASVYCEKMNKQQTTYDNLVLPVGTRVVLRKEIEGAQAYPHGAIGVVFAAPSEAAAYRVRMPDGGEIMLRREELAILASFQREGLAAREETTESFPVRDYVILRCIVGSRAYGLDNEASDTDVRGIYLPPARMQWSLHGLPEQIEFDQTQEVYWELQKFLTLALKANPNALECLWTPLVEQATPLAEKLLALRDVFLSQLVYQTYNGYVMGQFKKLEQDIRTTGAIKWKHAMHLIRLLLEGITVLREGYVPVRVTEHRDELLAIRHGLMPWPEVNSWRLALHAEFDATFRVTRLPERPDYGAADDFLIKARRSMVE